MNVKKRKLSDGPGEKKHTPIVISPRQLRVRASKPVAPDKKKLKLDKEAAILAALDELHQQRMTLITDDREKQKNAARLLGKMKRN